MRTPRGELNEWVDFDLYVAANVAGFQPHPEGVTTEAEKKRWRKEMQEREARRRPPGFQADWSSFEMREGEDA